MKYTADWRQDGPDTVVITPGGMGLVRLFGLPFAAVGGWFLYQFLGGVLHPSELTIFGWILLPIMTAAFLVPGWIILFGRKRTRLDTTRREAVEEFDFLVYTRRKSTLIPRESHVLVRYEEGGTSEVKGPLTTRASTGFTTNVYIDPRGAQPAPGAARRAQLILLALFGGHEKPRAMEFAHKVAGLLGLDVQDRCYEHGEIAAGGIVVDRLGPDDAD
jgi:hypothetical protein